MHGQAGQCGGQRQVFFGFQDVGYRVRVFVEDAVVVKSHGVLV